MIITEPSPTARVPWGLRIGLAWVGVVLIWTAVGGVRNLVLLPSGLPYDGVQVVQAGLTAVLAVGWVIVLCRRLDRRPLASIGLGATRRDGRAFLAGAGLWFGFGALALVVAVAVDAFPVALRSPGAALAGALALRVVLAFLFEALPEELALRGYVLTVLRERLPDWLAVIVSAVLFTLWAYAMSLLQQGLGFPTSWDVSVERTVLFLSFGLTLALVRLWTGSLWGSIGFHLAFQTVTQLLAADRLILTVPAGVDRETAMVFCWFFPVVIGGIVALVGVLRARRPAPAPR